jgi:hypothetical protein
MSDLSSTTVLPKQKLASDHNARADARTDGDINQVVNALSFAIIMLAQYTYICVII